MTSKKTLSGTQCSHFFTIASRMADTNVSLYSVSHKTALQREVIHSIGVQAQWLIPRRPSQLSLKGSRWDGPKREALICWLLMERKKEKLVNEQALDIFNL